MTSYLMDNDFSDDEIDDNYLNEDEIEQLKVEQEYEDNNNLLEIIKDFRENYNPLILDKLDPVKFLLFLDSLNPRPNGL